MIPPQLAAIASRIGLTGLAIAVLVALLAVQTVRLEGFKVWPLSYEGARPKAERMERERDACHEAGEQNTKAQKAQKAAYEARYKDLAHDADEQVERAQVDAAAATDRYIAAHRVRRNEGGVSAPVGAADSGGAESDQRPGAETELVAVTPGDIRICTANTIRLEAAYEWAKGLAGE